MRLIRSLLLCVLFFSCNDKKNNPDVSDIKINLSTMHFEQAFFNIDTLNTMAEMNTLATKYPGFTQNFLLNILKKGTLQMASGLRPQQVYVPFEKIEH